MACPIPESSESWLTSVTIEHRLATELKTCMRIYTCIVEFDEVRASRLFCWGVEMELLVLPLSLHTSLRHQLTKFYYTQSLLRKQACPQISLPSLLHIQHT